MNPTHRLRLFTRWVTLWFVLSLGVAVASPLVLPRPTALICTGNGAMMLVVQTDDGAVALGSHGLDCPLCANLSAPPPHLLLPPAASLPAARIPQTTKPGLLASDSARPWHARAPPTLF